MLTMLIDHIGVILFPQNVILKIIGRISMPIYAYLISEGCLYTRNKLRRFLQIFALGLGCQIVYFVVEKNFELNILLSFSVSILLCYLALLVKNQKINVVYLIFALIAVYHILEFLKDYKIFFDYGFYGILLPVLIILPNNYYEKFIATILGVALLSFKIGGIQWWSLTSLIPMALYNGQKGKLNIKYMFYAFYPIHIAVIYLIKLVL